MAEYQATSKTLTLKNDLLNKRLDESSKQDFKRRGKGSRILFKLDAELTNAKTDITPSLERNSVLEKELVRVMTKLNKSLTWITSSQILNNLTNQESSSKRG